MSYTLITDRTQADVDTVKRLEAKGWKALTMGEQNAWYLGLKGAYDADNLTRIRDAIVGIGNELWAAGYIGDMTLTDPSMADSLDVEWYYNTIPMADVLDSFLKWVKWLRTAIAVPPETPAVPDSMNRFTWKQANDLEQVLVNIKQSIDGIVTPFCGEVFTGEW